MLNTILSGNVVDLTSYLICLACALLCGAAAAFFHSFRNESTRGFLLTLILLPPIVMSVIMVVNGNLGAGVATMGAFSLIRFRSMPGSAREILSIFLAMASGLAIGMGYVGLAGILVLTVGLVSMVLSLLPAEDGRSRKRELRITIPESLDYTEIFDDIFRTYTSRASLQRVKTTNMGSLYELQYHIELKDPSGEKDMLDEIRVRNGNLEIISGRIPDRAETL